MQKAKENSIWQWATLSMRIYYLHSNKNDCDGFVNKYCIGYGKNKIIGNNWIFLRNWDKIKALGV